MYGKVILRTVNAVSCLETDFKLVKPAIHLSCLAKKGGLVKYFFWSSTTNIYIGQTIEKAKL